MATIVRIRETDRHALLVGVGYGMFKSARGNVIFGDLFPKERSGEGMMAAVSTADGQILWCPTGDLEVVSIDGVEPKEHLRPYFSGDGESEAARDT